jgi:hypothetical protein
VQWNQAFHVSFLVNYSLFAPYRKDEEVGNNMEIYNSGVANSDPNALFLSQDLRRQSPFVEGSLRRMIDRGRTVLEAYFSDIPDEQAV